MLQRQHIYYAIIQLHVLQPKDAIPPILLTLCKPKAVQDLDAYKVKEPFYNVSYQFINWHVSYHKLPWFYYFL